MSTYKFYVSDPTNIATKINIINQRIDIDPEINSVRLSGVYIAPNIDLTFATPLTFEESNILNSILLSVVNDLIPGEAFQYRNKIETPRNISNSNIAPTTQYDIFGGYNVGSMIYNSIDNSVYICTDATPNNAKWNNGITGPTGPQGPQEPQGPIGNIVFNIDGELPKARFWVGTEMTSGGIAKFDISSARFEKLYSVVTGVEQDAKPPEQPWAVITEKTTTNIIVTVYNTVFTGTTILGIPVLQSGTTEIYQKEINVSIIAVGE